MNTPGLFIAGTDTGVGKTRVAATLCRGLVARGRRVAAMKPVASGCVKAPKGLRSADAIALLSAMNAQAPYSDVNPYAFEPAIAPHLAAAEAGVRIDVGVLDAAFKRLGARSDLVIVEGCGGWLCPLDETSDLADLAARWRLDVILVVGMRLGCLSHALLTAESIERRGLRLRGWVANAIDPEYERLTENISSLGVRLAAPFIGRLDYAPHCDPQQLAAALALDLVAGPAA